MHDVFLINHFVQLAQTHVLQTQNDFISYKIHILLKTAHFDSTYHLQSVGQLQKAAKGRCAATLLEGSTRVLHRKELCLQQAWVNLVLFLHITHLGDRALLCPSLPEKEQGDLGNPLLLWMPSMHSALPHVSAQQWSVCPAGTSLMLFAPHAATNHTANDLACLSAFLQAEQDCLSRDSNWVFKQPCDGCTTAVPTKDALPCWGLPIHWS